MLTFHPLGIEDKTWIDERVFASGTRSADYSFGSMFMWDGRYRQLVCDFGGRLVALAHAHGAPIYPFPVGSGELEPVIGEMRAYARENGFPFVIRGVEERALDELERLFPGKFEFSEDREFADYIYSAEKLDTLSGKKLHAKRNYVNRFCAEREWSFRELEQGDFPACLELLRHWREGEQDEDIIGEHEAIMRCFEHYSELELAGGALFVGGELIAFAVGERISADTADVHFEKAVAEIDGAYAMINRELARLMRARWPELKYINREDDMGLENLRQSKLSYHPEYLLRKFTATWRA
ncbi:MAG: phosphatidylglycerol lysyltransferase domain-containing protein [Butyricicoccus sp.]|nr:phosphatidylglycerol lysyltransferase domain-containing protein [Butyricicoccus sp.]